MKKKIKIVRIQSRICIGGPAIHTALLSKYLPDDYETVLVGGAVEEGEFCKFEELKRDRIEIRIIPEMRRAINPWCDALAIWKLYKLIKKEKPDIVHTHTSKAGAVGRIAALMARVPLIFYTFHGHAFEHYFPRSITEFFKLVEKILARFSTEVVAISPKQKYDITKKFNIVPQSKCRVVRLGFDLQPFFQVHQNGHLKQKLGLGEDVFLIGSIGRLVPIKNHTLALRILYALVQNDKRFHLCIVGDGPERIKLENKAQRLDISSHVHFTGWEEDTRHIYGGIDMLLLTSLNEGTPVTLIEAMAARVPVISTHVGGVPDLINGKNGYTFPLRDEQLAVQYILNRSKSKSAFEEQLAGAQEFVSNHYAYSRLVKDIDQLYKDHLGKLN